MPTPCPGGPRVPDQPHGPVKPTRPLPFSTPTRQSQVALDPHTNVWTIASTFPRRNPTFVHSSGPNFTGTHGTKGSSIRLRCLESLHFPGRSSDTPTTSLGQPNSSPPAKLRKNRLQGLSWNIGSLGTYKFDILRQWMHQQQLDLIQLQDTRWGFTGDWTDNTFAYIHSGSQDRAGGLLTIIRKAFCPPDRLSWREVTPGRLLHARLYLDSTGLDLVNFYQHPWTGSDQQCRDKRSGLLDALDGLLAGLPQQECGHPSR